jgi:hypothetical protein
MPVLYREYVFYFALYVKPDILYRLIRYIVILSLGYLIVLLYYTLYLISFYT